MSIDSWAIQKARANFEDAHRKSLIISILDMLRRQPNEMIPFDEVRARLNVRGQRSLGHQTVPIERIVGSEGRYGDFDRHFLPRSKHMRDRWARVDSAMIQAIELPPIELYKIGGIYFVRDGNHRVSAARQEGQAEIDAYVTELIVDVPLTSDLSMRDMLLKEEYSDFLEWTDLHSLRPAERIEFSELGGYLDLVRHINAHRYYMAQGRETLIARDEAVTHWYDDVYMPVIEAIRANDVLKYFPGRTEADLYRWIMEHRWYMGERIGSDPGPEAATREYLELFGHRSIIGAIDSLLEKLGIRH